MSAKIRHYNRGSRLMQISLPAVLILAAASAGAQDDGSDPSKGEYVMGLKACQAITEDTERLACFDKAVGEIVSANDSGDVRIIDREDIRNTRRQLFGLSVPDVGVLERDEEDAKEESDLLETTITSVRYLSAKNIRFTTSEGATWEIKRPPRWFRTIKQGQSVVFKKAALGTFFIRVDGQLGVKGKRIQ